MASTIRQRQFLVNIEKTIERGRQGDETALGSLYRAYHRQMTGICHRIVGNRQVAEELAHDAFLLAFAKLDQLRNPQRFEAWLTSITTNVALRYVQRHHEPTMLSLSTLSEEVIDSADSLVEELPGEPIPAEDKPLPTMAELMAAVDALPNGYGQVFKLAVIREMIVTRPVIPETQRDMTRRMAVVPNIQQSKDSITATDTILHMVEPSDTMTIIDNDKPLPEMRHNNDTHIADLSPEHRKEAKSRLSEWSMDLAYSGSMYERSQYSPFAFEGMVKDESLTNKNEEMEPVDFKKWSDYADYLSEYPDGGKNHDVILNVAKNNASQPGTDEIVRKSHHYMPVSWSLALRYKLNSNFGLETGVSYSRLKSEFDVGSNGNSINEQQTIHYLGIPLKVLYNIYDGRQWSIYGSMGVKLEVPVYAPLNTNYYLNGQKEATEKSTLNAPLQWSVGTGLGLQYNLTPHVGFFAEPSLQYYIPTGGNIETYRTEHPFTFSLPLGIRITW